MAKKKDIKDKEEDKKEDKKKQDKKDDKNLRFRFPDF